MGGCAVHDEMDDRALQKWVEQISLESFNRPFLHKAMFNHRLRTTGGRYFLNTHDIEISWRQYKTFGPQEIEKIIKHELCHYHLHILGKGYRHRDADFRTLLRQVGGSRYCQAINDPERKVQPYRYKLECKKCKQQYWRKRKVNLKRYACGICRGSLEETVL